MGTKNNPGQFDCYHNAAPDEPMFVLLARDPLAPILVEAWAALRDLMRPEHGQKVAEALACAQDMRDWKRRRDRDIAASLIDGPEEPRS